MKSYQVQVFQGSVALPAGEQAVIVAINEQGQVISFEVCRTM